MPVSQKRLQVSTTIRVLVEANPERAALWVQNTSDDVIFAIYYREENPYGGMYVRPGEALYWEPQDSPHEKWFVRTYAGTDYLRVVEFF